MEKIIAPMARAKPNSKPKTRAVKIIANTLTVVPEQRKELLGLFLHRVYIFASPFLPHKICRYYYMFILKSSKKLLFYKKKDFNYLL